MVPTLRCGLSRWNLAFATLVSLLLLSCWCSSQDEPIQDISFPSGAAVTSRSGPVLVAHDLLGDVRRYFLIAVELHRVGGPALSVGSHVGGVAEHLSERDVRRNHLRVAALLHAEDVATTAVEVTDHLTHELFRRDDLNGEHGLEQYGLGPRHRCLERQRAGHPEGDLRRVSVVVLAIGKRHAHVDHRVASPRTVVHRVLDALLDRRDELRRDRTALDLVDEVKSFAGRRLEIDVDDPVLTGAAGLAHEPALDLLRRTFDRLTVGDLWAADVRVDLVLAQH